VQLSVARKFAREAVFHVDTVYTLVSTKKSTNHRVKTINHTACQEHSIVMVYNKTLAQHSVQQSTPQAITNKSIHRHFRYFTPVAKDHPKLQCIGSLIELLEMEVPGLVKWREMLGDIEKHWKEDGWPLRVEFDVKKNVWVTLNCIFSNSTHTLVPEFQVPFVEHSLTPDRLYSVLYNILSPPSIE